MTASPASDAPTMLPLPLGLSSADYARRVDPWIAGSALTLVAIGVVAVYSGSALLAAERHGSASFFLLRHLGAVLVGVTLLLVVARIPLERWSALAYPLLGLAFVLLVLTVASPWGRSAHGAERWLALGPVRVQAGELAKLAVVLYLAHSLAKKRERVSTFSVGFLPHVLVVSGLALLVLKQPDLGTSAVIYATLAAMLFVAGTRTAYLAFAVLLAIPVGWVYVARHPHALERIRTFLAPEADPTGSGYQIIQSLTAFGSGGAVGMGVGEGSQKLFFLPEPHTDFVFATIGQELGFAGVSVVVLAFGILVGRSFWIASRLPCRFPMFVTFGIASWLGMQALVNMGVTVALLPTKGLTLPLVSYGRSSLLVGLVGVGLLLRASAEAAAQREVHGSGSPPRGRRC